AALLSTSLFFSPAAAVAVTPVTCASPVDSQAEPTEYFVSLADPGTHLAHVSVRLRGGAGTRTLDMPVWNALYQVRDFATHVEQVRTQDASGAPVEAHNTKTSEWNVTAPAGCVVVSY